MKRFTKTTVLGVLLFVSGNSFADNPAKGTSPSFANSNIHKLGMRFRQAMEQVQRDQKSGKLTPAQAKALRAQIGTIRKAEIADMKTNGNKTLTDTQATQLNGQLDQLQPSL